MTALRFFEDIVPGEEVRAGPVHVTRESILRFAQMYDPQPFHLDEAAAARSLLGGLSASGWQTSAFAMRLNYEAFVRNVASMGAPGVEEVRWTKPVRPDDELSLILTVGDKRESASKPDRGFVNLTLDMLNAAGERVMLQRGPLIVARRDAAVSQQARPSETSLAVARDFPPDLMLAGPFDEIAIGQTVRFGTQHLTADAITHFASLYDPQPFHISEEGGRASHFGGLVASGWQTVAFWMKHYIGARRRSAEARAAAGLPVVEGGPSPGIGNLRWLRPVYAGSSVTYGMTVTGKRKTTRPGWALVAAENTGHMADGTCVLSFESTILWPSGA